MSTSPARSVSTRRGQVEPRIESNGRSSYSTLAATLRRGSWERWRRRSEGLFLVLLQFLGDLLDFFT